VKNSTATTPLPSLAARGGGEDSGAGVGDEMADVRERDLVLVSVAEAIRGYEQHHGLRELGERPCGSGRRGQDGEGWPEQDEWVAVRATVRSTRRMRACDRGGGRGIL
jgi:hypothetical protein